MFQNSSFRLNEFTLKLPSLRERVDDIPYPAAKFENEVEKELNKKCGGLSPGALRMLSSYSWPGFIFSDLSDVSAFKQIPKLIGNPIPSSQVGQKAAATGQ